MKKFTSVALLLMAVSSTALATGTWTSVPAPPTTNGIGTMELLSDGTVLAQEAGYSANWYKLTPSNTGSYSAGTWTTITPMSLARKFYATEILPNGRMMILGGEYTGTAGTHSMTNTGEIYNPTTGSWTPMTNFPESQFGDDPTEMLPNGNVLAGSPNTANTYIYNVAGNSWTATGTKYLGDKSDEESWVKGITGILSYDVWDTTSPHHAQLYQFSTGTWVDGGSVPVALSTPMPYYELGPGLRLPYNGKYLYLGATGHTALDSSGTWTAGPDIPLNGTATMGANDTPAAVMPNGKVLFAATTTPALTSPTVLDEYDPVTNTMSAATAPSATIVNLFGVAGYNTRMLDLPSGQVLFTTGNGGSNGMGLYTGTGSPLASWKPVISSIVNNGGGIFTLTGTLLNGLDEGAAYGDDAEMSTNFPIIQCTDSLGHVLYAYSYNWSQTGINTGTETVVYKLPTGLGSSFTIRAIANGIASDPFTPPPVMFSGTSSLEVAVPEPASLGILTLVALPLLTRRKNIAR